MDDEPTRVQPLRMGELLTARRAREVMCAAAAALPDDRTGWAPGCGEQVARWLAAVASELTAGLPISDEQSGALAVANAYLRAQQTTGGAQVFS